MTSLLNKQVSLKAVVVPILALMALFFIVSCTDASQSSFAGQQTAIDKWGQPGAGITNFYEYKQMQDIYTARDNPNLVLYAYLYSQVNGQLTCLGKVLGFGVPYGTQMSPPTNGTQPVPEPNSLYPSASTNADWIRLLGPDGKPHITFAEPDLIITDLVLPCTPLKSGV